MYSSQMSFWSPLDHKARSLYAALQTFESSDQLEHDVFSLLSLSIDYYTHVHSERTLMRGDESPLLDSALLRVSESFFRAPELTRLLGNWLRDYKGNSILKIYSLLGETIGASKEIGKKDIKEMIIDSLARHQLNVEPFVSAYEKASKIRN